jgi:UDP-glucose 4-epimerase
VGTGTETSVNQLYSVMATLAGVDVPPRYAAARPGELRRSALDPGRAAVQLGWKPWTTLEDGTSAVLRWFSRQEAEQGGN